MKKLTNALVGKNPANDTIEVYSKYVKALINTLTILTITILLFTSDSLAGGQTRFVTNTNDSGSGSLRDVIGIANSDDQIKFSPTVFNSPKTIILTSGEISFAKDLTIINDTRQRITISGNSSSRIFIGVNSDTAQTKSLILQNMTLTDGLAPPNQKGGAISLTRFRLVLQYSTVMNSEASTGGGISLSGNTNASSGSSIYNATIANNTATNVGGGIEFDTNTPLIITSSTIALNESSAAGGGIYAGGSNLGTITLKQSIIGDNISTFTQNKDLTGNFTSTGYNLIGDTLGSVITGDTTGNITNVDPLLEKLDYYGGTAPTVALNKFSPAIDAGTNSGIPGNDQRGFTRSIENGRISNARVTDIGAFEFRNRKFDVIGDGDLNFPVIRLPQNNISNIGNSNDLTWYFSLEPNFGSAVPPIGNVAIAETYGTNLDLPVIGDYDGDGIYDKAIYRPSDGTWYIDSSSNELLGYRWGIASDIPVPADYDNDGRTDVAVYRNGDWYILGTKDGYTGIVNLGSATNIPIPADYDGDGKADIAIFDDANGTWTIKESSGNTVTKSFGQSNDIPIPSDFDGDGKANLAVYRPSNNTWYIAKPNGVPAQNFDAYQFGTSGDIPTPTDFDGDGRTDVAIYRDGTWWILQSSDNSVVLRYFGLSNDYPPMLAPSVYMRYFQ